MDTQSASIMFTKLKLAPALAKHSTVPSAETATSSTRKAPRMQMNSCFVCNSVFLMERASSEDVGRNQFQNLCKILQVSGLEMFTSETNPLCQKCTGTMEEFHNLQRQIQGLLSMLGELRKVLGQQLVSTYTTTATNRKNYRLKAKMYEVWFQRLKAPSASTTQDISNLEENFTTIVNSLNDEPVAVDVPLSDQRMLDISSSVTLNNQDNSSIDGNRDSFDDCPSPYDASDGVPSPSNDTAGHEQIGPDQPLSVSKDPDAGIMSDILIGSGTSPASSGNTTGVPPPSKPEPPDGFVDRRRLRPVLVTKRRTHPCKYCGKLFPSRFALEMHERTHTGEKPFECDICGRKFVNKAAMQKHQTTHDRSRYEGEPQYECDLCGKKYHLERSLYTHKRDHMGIKRKKRRKPRDPNGPPPGKYKKKQDSKKPKPPRIRPPKPDRYVCEICPEVDGEKLSYKHRRALKKHEKRYHSGIERAVIRKRVKKAGLDADGNLIREEPKRVLTIKSDTLNRSVHQRMLAPRKQPGDPEKRFVCTDCPAVFAWAHLLEAHRRIHTGEKPYQCPKCDKCCAAQGNLDKHMRSHDTTRYEGEPSHVCDFCGKAFYVLGTLYHHRRKKHLGMEEKYKKKKENLRRPCECKICGQTFPTYYSLTHHKLKHGERRHKCSVCEKPFFTSSEANEHAKKHNPDWAIRVYFRYECPACPPETLGFQSKVAIREHWANEHSQRLPDTFRKPPKRKGEYVCQLCPEGEDGKRPTYRYRSSRDKHKKRHHSSGSAKVPLGTRCKSGSAKGKKRKQLEDHDGTSDSESDSDSDFNSDDDRKDEQVTSTLEPVRRSLRKTRADTSVFRELLKDSESECEDEFIAVKSQTPIAKRRVLAEKSPSKKQTVNARRSTTTPNLATKMIANSTNKDANVHEICKKEIRIVLTRVDCNDSGCAIKISTPIRKTPAHATNQRTSRSISRGIARKSTGTCDIPVFPESNVSSDVDDHSNLISECTAKVPILSTHSDDVDVEIKHEIERSMDDSGPSNNVSTIPNPGLWSSPSTKPIKSFSIIIHNPLSKDRNATPIVIPVRLNHSAAEPETESCSIPGNHDSDNDETVLGM